MADQTNENNAAPAGGSPTAGTPAVGAPVAGVPTTDGINVFVPNYLQDMPVQVDVILGSMKLSVKELMNCGPGSVIDVGKRVTDPFDLYINNIMVARGEIVMMHDRIGIKITEVVENGAKMARR